MVTIMSIRRHRGWTQTPKWLIHTMSLTRMQPGSTPHSEARTTRSRIPRHRSPSPRVTPIMKHNCSIRLRLLSGSLLPLAQPTNLYNCQRAPEPGTPHPCKHRSRRKHQTEQAMTSMRETVALHRGSWHKTPKGPSLPKRLTTRYDSFEIPTTSDITILSLREKSH